jgi:hypothetical protein
LPGEGGTFAVAGRVGHPGPYYAGM